MARGNFGTLIARGNFGAPSKQTRLNFSGCACFPTTMHTQQTDTPSSNI